MTTTDRDQLKDILDLLDELLDSDTLDQEEWHRISRPGRRPGRTGRLGNDLHGIQVLRGRVLRQW